MSPKKLIGQLHLWLEITSGLVVFILGITGCIYAFEEEIKARAADKLEVNVPTVTETLTLSQNLEAAQHKLGEMFPIQGVIMKNALQSSLVFRHFQREEERQGFGFGAK